MEENIIIVVNHDNLCRLCLNYKGAMSDIFENDEEITLQQQILFVTGLNAQPNDNLPSKICHKCRYIVELSCELRDVVGKTQRILGGLVHHQDETQDPQTHEETDKENINNNIEPIIPGTEHINLSTDESPTNVIIIDSENTALINNAAQFNSSRGKVSKHLVCQICLTPFTSTEEVRDHVLMHYEGTEMRSYLDIQRPYKCEGCGEEEISKKQLVVHHRRHLGVNPYVCRHPGCSYVGKNQDSLRHHRLVHGGRGVVCERCGASFRRRWELRQHSARRHAGDGPPAARAATDYRFKCPYMGCEKAYQSRGALAAHERAHGGERAFRCHLCHVAAYTSVSLLNRHLRLHVQRRVSRCDKCPLQFSQYAAFYRHRVAAHGPWQPHRCLACSQGYQSEGQLTKHLSRCERARRMRGERAGAARAGRAVDGEHAQP